MYMYLNFQKELKNKKKPTEDQMTMLKTCHNAE